MKPGKKAVRGGFSQSMLAPEHLIDYFSSMNRVPRISNISLRASGSRRHGYGLRTLFALLLVFTAAGSFAAGRAAAENGAESSDLKRYRDPKVLAEVIETGEPPHLVVDVRTAGEYDGGHIPTAVNIPVQVIADKAPEVPKDRLIVVYCRSGNRSARAAQILEDLGYQRVVDFGGIYRWENSLK